MNKQMHKLCYEIQWMILTINCGNASRWSRVPHSKAIKLFISFTDANHELVLHAVLKYVATSVEIQKNYAWHLFLDNILHGFSLMLRSTISSVVVDRQLLCSYHLTLLAMLYPRMCHHEPGYCWHHTIGCKREGNKASLNLVTYLYCCMYLV